MSVRTKTRELRRMKPFPLATVHLNGLAKRLHASGIIPNPAADRTLTEFGHGFSRAQPLFNFVDVGPGKEAADHKIRETLRLMVRNNQCKHIFFGPCHDNGYLPVLGPYDVGPGINSRLTLIETTAAEEGFKSFISVESRFLRYLDPRSCPSACGDPIPAYHTRRPGQTAPGATETPAH
ncbi:c-x8-c-x5-c-x3-h type zinc finger protein [Colletotrichum kahawae]|uniref:C-x8-c-x5-c-x3-h type zinc finger protein n=1 Tax=Colletotrichum kahawae TaxID=34407 RepID=A0AAD9YCX1_COLKA|nr:c-x8-c-x5-c-x3-h type zinc finger protein [Colletotrichum kahawae]